MTCIAITLLPLRSMSSRDIFLKNRPFCVSDGQLTDRSRHGILKSQLSLTETAQHTSGRFDTKHSLTKRECGLSHDRLRTTCHCKIAVDMANVLESPAVKHDTSYCKPISGLQMQLYYFVFTC